jgi:hypothetical protein
LRAYAKEGGGLPHVQRNLVRSENGRLRAPARRVVVGEVPGIHAFL